MTDTVPGEGHTKGLSETEWVVVPKAALEWLNGEAADPSGHGFGDFPEDHPKPAGEFWWRRTFKDICDYYDRTFPKPSLSLRSDAHTNGEVKAGPDRLWLSAADTDNEHEVWFDPDEGGTPYIRADLALVAWRIVPVEPTDEMASAAISLDPKVDLDAKYRAMIAAAPTPEAFGFVPVTAYEAAVKGRQDFRQALRAAKGMTETAVIGMLRERFDASGLSYDKFGETVGLSGEFLRLVMTFARRPSKAILELLGLEEAVVYRPVASPHPPTPAGVREITDAAAFLIDRLDDFERDPLQEDDGEYTLRQFAGHVSPAIERLRDAITAAEDGE